MTRDMGNVLKEERKHKRIQYARTINVKTRLGRNLQLEIFDYSISGMSLVSRTAFDQGDILEFESLITQGGNKRILALKGEVIHNQKESRGNTFFGVCFL